jgi:hypothetical protein
MNRKNFLIRKTQIKDPNEKNHQGKNYPNDAVGFLNPFKGSKLFIRIFK